MKTMRMKILLAMMAVCGLLACNSGSNSTTSADSTSPSPTNVQNVNGNTPDTTSGINLNQPMPVDSSRMKDSAQKNTRH
jgi:ABC-type oligopeptide transport system substrate-binding subunit